MINQKLIVFHSSPDFSDNPRALYDYVSKNTDYECFWVINDRDACESLLAQGIPCGLRSQGDVQEKIDSAQYLVSSSFEFAYEKKAGQIHVSAWHGFGPKVIGFFDSASQADSFKPLTAITTQSDIIAITSRSSQILTSGMFATDPRKAFITGFARNDYLYTENGRANLASIFGQGIVGSKTKFIFYLPTMRKGLKAEGAQFNENIFNYHDYDADEIDAFLEKHDACVVTKLHFADNNLIKICKENLPNRVLFISNEDLLKRQLTIYHLLNGFDTLITDYSSVYADYMLLDRPIVFSCPDFSAYQNDRGFIANDPRFMMPGTFVESQRSLIKELDAILRGEDRHKQYRDFMMPYFHAHTDGNSSQRLFDTMVTAARIHVPDCHKDYASLYVDQGSPLRQYVTSSPFSAEIFFDFGDGYSEENKRIFTYKLDDADDDGFIRINFQLPDNRISSLRFDPDSSNRIIINGVSLEIGGISLLPAWTNGVMVKDKIFFPESDPQVHFQDIHVSGRQNACLKFRAFDFLCDGIHLLIEAESDSINKPLNRIKSKLFKKH